MDLTLLQLSAALATVFIGSLVQGLLGFGLAVIVAPILYLIDPVLVPGPATMIGLSLSLLVAIHYRKTLSLYNIRYAVLGQVPGAMIGAFLLRLMPAKAIAIILGISVLLAVMASLTRYRFRATSPALFSAGLISGVMWSTTSISGPPMALVLINEKIDRVRADLALYFVIGSLVSLAALGATAQLTLQQLLLGTYLVPAVFLGHWAAIQLADRVSANVMRIGLLLLCSVSGICTLIIALY